VPTTSDESWAAYRNYADRVTVTVVPVDHPSADHEADDAWVLISNGAAWDHDWLLRHVHELAALDPDEHGGAEAPHILEVGERHSSWGADAAAVDILLFLAQWAATSAAWDATKALATRMQRRLDDGEASETEQPLTEAEAEARARWTTTARWKIAEDQLELVSIEIEPPAKAAVVLIDNNGWRYECDLVAIGNNVTTSRLKRCRQQD